MSRARTASPQPHRRAVTVAGHDIGQEQYAGPNDPHLPEGTLTGFQIQVSRPVKRRGEPVDVEAWIASRAIVLVDGVNPDERTVRSWGVGYGGWLPVSFSTAEDAVRAVCNPTLLKAMCALRDAERAAAEAERVAREKRVVVDGLREKLAVDAQTHGP